MEVVESARRCNSKAIVAFGIGGDELSVPTRNFALSTIAPDKSVCTG